MGGWVGKVGGVGGWVGEVACHRLCSRARVGGGGIGVVAAAMNE